MKNFVAKGESLEYTNGTGTAIASGAVVVVGSRVGVAAVDIANTAAGTVELSGVYTVAKDSSSFVQGAEVYWDESEAKATSTATDNKFMGYAHKGALTGAATMDVCLAPAAGLNTAGTADVVAALGTTTNLAALVVTATTIAASDLTAANASAPTKAEVDAGIDTLKTAVVTALDLKADNADVETLRTAVEARLDAIETKVDLILTKLKAASLMASA